MVFFFLPISLACAIAGTSRIILSVAIVNICALSVSLGVAGGPDVGVSYIT